MTNEPGNSAMTDEDMQRQYEHIGSGLTLDKCPCGLCQKARSSWKSTPDSRASIAQPVPVSAQPSASALSDEVKESVCTAVAEALGDALDCTRTWSAWRYGTMRDGDFVSVAGDPERVSEIADAAINALLAALPVPVSEPIARVQSYVSDRPYSKGNRVMEVVFLKDVPDDTLLYAEPPQAVVAQPVDAEIACKAARYDWICMHCDVDYRGYLPEGYETSGEAIDAAIRAQQPEQGEGK